MQLKLTIYAVVRGCVSVRKQNILQNLSQRYNFACWWGWG